MVLIPVKTLHDKEKMISGEQKVHYTCIMASNIADGLITNKSLIKLEAIGYFAPWFYILYYIVALSAHMMHYTIVVQSHASWISMYILHLWSDVGISISSALAMQALWCKMYRIRQSLSYLFVKDQVRDSLVYNQTASCRSASGIGYTRVGYSASYPLNSWWIDGLGTVIELWQILCKHLFSFPSSNTSNMWRLKVVGERWLFSTQSHLYNLCVGTINNAMMNLKQFSPIFLICVETKWPITCFATAVELFVVWAFRWLSPVLRLPEWCTNLLVRKARSIKFIKQCVHIMDHSH